jgi:8-oxo-dGTP diphosphatase
MESAVDSHGRPYVAVALVVRGFNVLVIHRREGRGGLSWALPAGTIEPDETGSEAAVRETAEETGVIAHAERFLGRRVHPDTGRMVEYWLCSWISGEPHVRESSLDRAEWVPAWRVTTLTETDVAEPIMDELRRLERECIPPSSGHTL